jgi:TatD DNase family protein
LFGDNKLVKRVVENNWYISVGPIVVRSKKHFQIVRDMPIELLLLETDSPWNHPKVFTEHIALRNDPTSVKVVAQKIAEIKKISFEEAAKITTENAIKLFELPL